MIFKIERSIAQVEWKRTPYFVLVAYLAIAVLGVAGTPAVAAEEDDAAGTATIVAAHAGEDFDAPGAPRFFGSAVEWNLGDAESATVTLVDPEGILSRHEFGAGEVPRIEFDAQLSRGIYAWEIDGAPVVDGGGSPRGDFVANGFLKWDPELGVTSADRHLGLSAASEAAIGAAESTGNFTLGLCSGRRCGTGTLNPSPGPGSLYLADRAGSFSAQGARIFFFDSNEIGPNPSWILRGNNAAFSISGNRGGSISFTEHHSILGERVGVGTFTPAKDLHVSSRLNPTIRLERRASGGGTPRIWDIGAAATNFFVSNASLFPFQIQPGAPTGSLFLAANGNVGVGTDAPATKLHVFGANGPVSALIEQTGTPSGDGTLLELRTGGSTSMRFTNPAATPQRTWQVGLVDGGFAIDRPDVFGTELRFQSGNLTTSLNFTALSVSMSNDLNVGRDAFVGRDLNVSRHAFVAGNLTVGGQLITPSSRDFKRDFVPVDSQAVLDRVVALPVFTWSYSAQPSGRHMGPVSQDFRAAFGLGDTDQGIATVDSDGVALAAIQGLHQRLQEENAALRRRLEVLEEMVGRLAAAGSETLP